MSGRPALTLRQFMVRQQVLKLYRDCFRAIAKVKDESQRRDLKEWVRADFRANKDADPADEEAILAMLYNGEKMLREMKQSLDLAQA